MPARWSERIASAFWESAGGEPPFPRDLAPVITRVCDLVIVPQPDLTSNIAMKWLKLRDIDLPLEGNDRRAKGLVVAFRGRGVIFLDADLDTNERRVILAHEFAHHLLEYALPRSRVLRRLGPEVLPVLDAERPATTTEEWAGVLAGVNLGVHLHVLSREFEPGEPSALPPVERNANELALELLAPRRIVLPQIQAMEVGSVSSRLVTKYGFPPAWASGYSRILLSTSPPRSFTQGLGL
jgi:hypothetical protein